VQLYDCCCFFIKTEGESMGLIEVDIYKKDFASYTTFAEGFVVDQKHDNSKNTIFLKSEYPIILWYKFRQIRRVYVCTLPEVTNNENVFNFPNVNRELAVIKILNSRGYDQFKRTMDYLKFASDNEVYKLNPMFFWQLSSICDDKKNNQYTIERLWKIYSSYKLKKLSKEDWKELKKYGLKK